MGNIDREREREAERNRERPRSAINTVEMDFICKWKNNIGKVNKKERLCEKREGVKEEKKSNQTAGREIDMEDPAEMIL